MIKLPQTYKKNGYQHEIIYRDDVYAITKLTSNEDDSIICYEVFKIKKSNSITLNGNVIEARESTPSNESWGRDGYTVRTIQEAHNKIKLWKSKNGRKAMIVHSQ